MENLPWHIPKRCNLLQVIGSLHIIRDLKLDGKKWTRSNTKKYNQSLGTWGLTSSGGSLSGTARETLEALIKYLGFLHIDSQRCARITPAGHELIKEFRAFKKPGKKVKLRESEKNYSFTSSKVVKKQLFKLVISNPTIRKRELDKDTALKPFVETLRYLIDNKVGFLSREEMAMFVFFQQKPEEYSEVKKKILDFRKLSRKEQDKKIKVFSTSYIGNKVYAESSATVKYWESIVKLSGLLDEDKTGFYLKESSKKEARGIVDSYEHPESDVFEDETMWWEYYGNINISRYPRKVDYSLPNLEGFRLLLSYKPKKQPFLSYFEPKLKVDGDKTVRITVFPDENYRFNLKIMLDDSGKCSDINFGKSFSFGKEEYLKEVEDTAKVSASPPQPIDFKDDLQLILDKNELSEDYINSITQLLILLGVVSSPPQAKAFIGSKKALIKGGRFEKLFYELLREKEKAGIIGKVVEWRGKEESGIYYPSPAGKGFETDIEFIVDKYYFGFELTTARGRAQWKTEAESVTDHLQNLKTNLASRGQNYQIVGIFTAPKVTDFMRAICFYFSKFVYKLPILAIDGKEFFEILESSKSKEDFLKRINKYHKKIFKRELPKP